MPCAIPPPLVLASASPRRSALLGKMGLTFEALDPGIDEEGIVADGPVATARARAEAKARAAAWVRPGAVVLAADTVVVLEGRLLPKAKDGRESTAMVTMLSGRTHEVVTAVAVIGPGIAGPLVEVDVARVTFRELSKGETAAYGKSGEGVGKAGGYAVQGRAAGFVTSLEGDVETVVGLPTRLVRSLLERVRTGPCGDGDENGPVDRA